VSRTSKRGKAPRRKKEEIAEEFEIKKWSRKVAVNSIHKIVHDTGDWRRQGDDCYFYSYQLL
jgi:hypothetical protein